MKFHAQTLCSLGEIGDDQSRILVTTIFIQQLMTLTLCSYNLILAKRDEPNFFSLWMIYLV